VPVATSPHRRAVGLGGAVEPPLRRRDGHFKPAPNGLSVATNGCCGGDDHRVSARSSQSHGRILPAASTVSAAVTDP
jgi:hypothetical protein